MRQQPGVIGLAVGLPRAGLYAGAVVVRFGLSRGCVGADSDLASVAAILVCGPGSGLRGFAFAATSSISVLGPTAGTGSGLVSVAVTLVPGSGWVAGFNAGSGASTIGS